MIANLCDETNIEVFDYNIESRGMVVIRESTDILAYKRDQYFKSNFKATDTKFDNLGVYANMTWRELFIKLDFEHFLKYFRLLSNDNLEFGKFILYLKAASEIKGLFLNLYDSNNLKSGSYWIQALFTTLINLKHLTIQEYNPESRLHEKQLQYLKKGL